MTSKNIIYLHPLLVFLFFTSIRKLHQCIFLFLVMYHKQDRESYMYVATQQCISDDLYHVWKLEFAFGQALCRGLDIFLSQLKLRLRRNLKNKFLTSMLINHRYPNYSHRCHSHYLNLMKS